MDPSGPPQPTKATAYETKGNAATSNAAEERSAEHQTHGRAVDERLPTSQASGPGQQEGQPSSLGYGIRGAPAGEEQYGRSEENVGRHRELDGEQMSAPGEGHVADVVRRKPGASGSEPDLASDLDRSVFSPLFDTRRPTKRVANDCHRKKAEQASRRDEIKNDRQDGKLSDGGNPRAGVDT